MEKKTKIIIGASVIGVAAYFIWKNNQFKTGFVNASGDSNGKSSASNALSHAKDAITNAEHTIADTGKKIGGVYKSNRKKVSTPFGTLQRVKSSDDAPKWWSNGLHRRTYQDANGNLYKLTWTKDSGSAKWTDASGNTFDPTGKMTAQAASSTTATPTDLPVGNSSTIEYSVTDTAFRIPYKSESDFSFKNLTSGSFFQNEKQKLNY